MAEEYDVDGAKPPSNDEQCLELACALFNRVVESESETRLHELDDLRFRAASPDNFYQWPSSVRSQREADPSGQRPCLTINKIPQHVNQVVNDVRQNRPAIKVVPVDDKADVDTAEMLNGLIRHIQDISNAEVAYDQAVDNAVTNGRGYIRVLTQYEDESSFDQEILIKRIRNPFSVYMDPDINEPDGSDAQFCFVTEFISKAEFKRLYPDVDMTSWEESGKGDKVSNWFQEGNIRIAEWFQVEYHKEELRLWKSGGTTWKSEDAYQLGYADEGEEPLKTRIAQRKKIMWRKITACAVLEEREWPGQFIPIARVVGNEYDIEGVLHVSGLVRNAKDAQRMYNYWASQEVEMLALAPKAPFMVAAGQIEGFELKWAQANTMNFPYMEYNPVVETTGGLKEVAAPQRMLPPTPPSGFIQAKMGAADDIKTTTGQYDASLGAGGNETSGVAITRRDHQSDISTYHFINNLSLGIKYVGRIIVDLIPKVYDVARVVRILGEDGEPDQAHIDPSATQAKTVVKDSYTEKEVKTIYNPGVGKYDVAVVTGPSFTTKRQEALDAMVQMVQSNPELWRVIGDKLVKSMDWPGAQEMADRLKLTLLPEVQQMEEGNDIPPQVLQQLNQMKQEGQQMQAIIMDLQHKLQDKTFDQMNEAKKTEIDHYKAESDRMKALQAGINPQETALLAAQLVLQSLHSPAQQEMPNAGLIGMQDQLTLQHELEPQFQQAPVPDMTQMQPMADQPQQMPMEAQ